MPRHWKKSKRRQSKRYKRRHHQGRNIHHISNVSRGGTNQYENITLIDIEKHECWHKIFGHRDLYGAIQLLLRFSRLKGFERVNPAIIRYYEPEWIFVEVKDEPQAK